MELTIGLIIGTSIILAYCVAYSVFTTITTPKAEGTIWALIGIALFAWLALFGSSGLV